MKSGTRRKKNESKRNRDGLDMAQKALAEYEEAERRRYHERLRAEQKEAPPMSSNEKALRDAAIAIIDETCLQYAELYRTGRCSSCETILTWKDVDKQPEHELHEATTGRKASRYLEWTSKHAPDCGFMERYGELADLAARFDIFLATQALDVPMPDGKVMRDFVPVRVPAVGDPPEEDR